MKVKNMTNLYWFCQSVECGGFAAASVKARVSAPTISRAVANLEEQLNQKLLHRDAKNFQLTNPGEEIYNKFASLFNEIEKQWLSLSDSQETLTGDIHISCPEPFADFLLQPLAIEFMKAHPQVNIHVHFASNADGFIDNQIDLAVVNMPARTSHLVQRRLFETEMALGASPGYIKRYGMPAKVEDLVNHHLLAVNSLPFWRLKQKAETFEIPVKPKYSIHSLRLNIKAAIDDAGICLMPKAALDHMQVSGKLTMILPKVELPAGKAYLVWTDRKLVSSRVAAFRDLIFERVKVDADKLWTLMLAES